MNKKAKIILDGIDLFVLDMDGTIYLGEKIIEGSPEFVKTARDSGKRVLFFTNNASKTAINYIDKLLRLGFEATLDDIVTSGDVTIEYLKKYFPGKRVYLNGTPHLEQSFREAHIRLVNERPDVCIQSFDTTLNYKKLQDITDFIREGSTFLATHCDINCPTETGFMPDCGAMCALITASTGIEPIYLGKPMNETVEMIEKITHIPRERIAFVGDRIYTDVACGVSNGAKGILVLSGESDMKTVEESEIVPTLIFESIKEIIPYIKQER